MAWCWSKTPSVCPMSLPKARLDWYAQTSWPCWSSSQPGPGLAPAHAQVPKNPAVARPRLITPTEQHGNLPADHDLERKFILENGPLVGVRGQVVYACNSTPKFVATEPENRFGSISSMQARATQEVSPGCPASTIQPGGHHLLLLFLLFFVRTRTSRTCLDIADFTLDKGSGTLKQRRV